MKRYAVIVAGGTGSRAGGGMPKQFRPLCRRMAVWYALHAFAPLADRIVLVIHPDWRDYYIEQMSMMPKHERIEAEIVEGGPSRLASVRAALEHLADSETDALVAIHDAARPLINKETIIAGWNAAAIATGAVPVVPVTDSLAEISTSTYAPVDRSHFRAIQTPQVFPLWALLKAYRALDTMSPEKLMPLTDDASVAHIYGIRITTYDGSDENIKITRPVDFLVAQSLLEQRGWNA